MAAARLRRLVLAILAVIAFAAAAQAYIHFPPMTLPKMCAQSHFIRVLKVEKSAKDKSVVLFTFVETLKGEKPRITSFRHSLGPDAEGTKSIRDSIADGKPAVLFSIENKEGKPEALGYVFLDNSCYSVIYADGDACWHLIRAEPGLSACYHGSVGELRKAVAEILAGKEVSVPMKAAEQPEDRDRRRKEVNDVLEKIRGH